MDGRSDEGEAIRAAVLYRAGDLRLEHRWLPAPKPGWVVVSVEAAGICGTDVAVYRGRHPAKLPITLGHEFSGHVISVGESVPGLGIGQRVMAQAGWACGRCARCSADLSEECESRDMLGRTIDGCFADAVLVRADGVHLLPDQVTSIEAQSLTTLATALHAVQRAGDLNGKRVAIIGPGHAGLMLLQVCLVFGAGEVAVIGTRDDRLAVAQRLGATHVLNIRKESFDAWRAHPEHAGFAISFEASGTAAGLAQAFLITKARGTVVSYGIIDTPLDGVPGSELYWRELTVLGSKGSGDCHQQAIQLVSQKKIRVEPLVTHYLLLEDVKRGFGLMIDKPEGVIRVVFQPNGPSGSRASGQMHG